MICRICNILMRLERNRLFCPACEMTMIVKTCETCWHLGNMFGFPYCPVYNSFKVPVMGCQRHDPTETMINTSYWHDMMGWIVYAKTIGVKLG